jgi:nucleoside-diphosphate-sugar epimerase
MNRVLITGGSGFIGRHCVPLLASKGYEVHAVSRRPRSETTPNAFWHGVDLLGPGCAGKLISEVRPEYLLHLAWYAVPGTFWDARENIDWVRASLELFCAFADNGGKRMVSAGTCAEYDSCAGKCVENTTPLSPTTLYGTSKHAVERILHYSKWQTGLSSAWGRVFFPYGPNEHPSRVVAHVVRSLLRGEPALCSEGTDVLDFIHVEDTASAFIALLGSDIQGPVNIGSGKPTALRDLLTEIGSQLGRLDLVHFGARAPSSRTYRLWANTKRLSKEVGWLPRYSLIRGLEHTVEWWRSVTASPACHPSGRAEE